MGSMFGIEEDGYENEGCFRIAVRVIMYLVIATYVWGFITDKELRGDPFMQLFFLGIIAVLYILKRISK
jgi:hypothetical protein